MLTMCFRRTENNVLSHDCENLFIQKMVAETQATKQ